MGKVKIEDKVNWAFREGIAMAIHDGWYEWMAGRGYSYGEERDDDKLTHPHFIRWGNLSDSDKESSYICADSVIKLLLDAELIDLEAIGKDTE